MASEKTKQSKHIKKVTAVDDTRNLKLGAPDADILMDRPVDVA